MLIAGQFFTVSPDPAARQEQIRQLAQAHGLDSKELSAADQQPRVLSKSKQAKITVWLEKLANTFAIIGLERADMLDRLQRIATISVFTRE